MRAAALRVASGDRQAFAVSGPTGHEGCSAFILLRHTRAPGPASVALLTLLPGSPRALPCPKHSPFTAGCEFTGNFVLLVQKRSPPACEH